MATLFNIRVNNLMSTDPNRLESESLQKRSYSPEKVVFFELNLCPMEKGKLISENIRQLSYSLDEVVLLLKNYIVENDNIIQQILDNSYNVPNERVDIIHHLIF